jgi:Flp pilus assembly protein TadG
VAEGARERGSVLMLVPAAVLVLVILGAIAVDFSVAYLGQRELTNAASAAANDAATTIAAERFYRGDEAAPPGTVTIDEDRASQVISRALAARSPRGVAIHDVQAVPAGGQVCVVLRGRVDYVFARAVPGAPDGAAVEGRATATAVTGPPGSTVSPRPPC